MNIAGTVATDWKPPIGGAEQILKNEGGFVETTMRLWRVSRLHASDNLKMSYRLRYRVYCEERGFLDPSDYPNGLETDIFDGTSLHFGSFDAAGDLVGTSRLVFRSPLQFPMFEHCTIYPQWEMRLQKIQNLVEISRLAISRNYRRRAADGPYGLDAASDEGSGKPERRHQYVPVLSLFKGMYQAALTMGFTHALSAMEMSLHRLLSRYHFPLTQIGPECDYFGPVTPFIIDIRQLERQLAESCPDLLREFLSGLDPRYAEPVGALVS